MTKTYAALEVSRWLYGEVHRGLLRAGYDYTIKGEDLVMDGIALRPKFPETKPLHASVEHLMQFFAYEHLPAHLQEVSRPFGLLAEEMAQMLPSNPETTAALRKLLEAKDCAVRSLLAK